MTVKVSKSSRVTGKGSAFEVCRQAADAYLNSGKPLSITAKELFDSIAEATLLSSIGMESYDPLRWTGGPFIVDVRSPDSEMPALYYGGHIPGAIQIPWRQIAQPKKLRCLPRDRQIVVYSNTGQTGGQVASILSIMGYDAVNLKWGMTSWTGDTRAAPERYDKDRDIIWQSEAYRSTVTSNDEPTETYPLPIAETNGRDPATIISSAVGAYLTSFKPANISATELYDPLFLAIGPFSVSPYENESKQLLVLPFDCDLGDNEELFVWPFVLDVREDREYENGHIPGALHVVWRDVFNLENLKKLPPDRRIIVCSSTGHESAHVVALLNILGYDVANLKWGMSGWSPPLPGADVASDRYSNEKDCMDYPIVKGWNPAPPIRCST